MTEYSGEGEKKQEDSEPSGADSEPGQEEDVEGRPYRPTVVDSGEGGEGASGDASGKDDQDVRSGEWKDIEKDAVSRQKIKEVLGNRYPVKEEIGRGGVGLVFRGWDRTLNREVAIKVQRPENRDLKGSTMRFFEEAQVQGQLSHPNICPVHEVGEDEEGRSYFVMKLVEGKSLQDVLDRRLKGAESAEYLPKLLEVFVKVCDAVAFAHDRGVIHRDLKPENVMIGALRRSAGDGLGTGEGSGSGGGRSDEEEP